MKKRWLGLYLVGVMSFGQASQSVAADSKKEGEALNEEGRALSRVGKWDEARKKFEASYAKVGTPGVLFNLAWAEKNLKQYKAALKHFRLYLALPLTEKVTASARTDASKYSEECVANLCTLEVHGASKVSVDGESLTEVEPGGHKVVMDGARGSKSKDITCAAGQTVVVEYEEKASGPLVAPAPTMTSTVPPRIPDPPPVERMERGSWAVPAVLAGVGAVGLGVGFGLGAAASSEKDAAIASAALGPCADRASASCTSLRDGKSSANGLSSGAVVGYVAGGAFLTGALIATLVMRPWAERPVAQVQIMPVVGSGQTGLLIQGSFK